MPGQRRWLPGSDMGQHAGTGKDAVERKPQTPGRSTRLLGDHPSVRIAMMLNNMDLCTRKQIRAAVETGRLRLENRHHWPRQFGPKKYAELCGWQIGRAAW